MVLAQELGHIVLGHRLNTQYAFSDRMIFPDEDVFRRMGCEPTDSDELAADQKAWSCSQNLPIRTSLPVPVCFLRALTKESHSLTWLISPHYGNRMAKGSAVRMGQLAQTAPELETRNIGQLPALPLGSRIRSIPGTTALKCKRANRQHSSPCATKCHSKLHPCFRYLTLCQCTRKSGTETWV